MEFPQARLLIFAKAPIPGQVKTRLIEKYGARGAARLYRLLLHRTLKGATVEPLCPVQLWCAPHSGHAFFLACRRDYGLELRTQRGADLGQRMHHALAAALQNSAYALLIGSDCASLGTAELRSALQALQEGRDAVLGPAADGGYLLIGLRRPCGELLRGIPWSGPRVLAITRERLRQAGLEWTELSPGWDVDRPADVRRLQELFRENLKLA